MHPLLTAQQRVKRQDEDSRMEQTCRVMGAVRRLWPKADHLQSLRPAGTRGRRKRPVAETPHDWQFRGGAWVCATCFKRARTRQAIERRRYEECASLAPRMCAVVAHPRGHVLVAAEDGCGKPLLVCLNCGNWAESKPRALLQGCRGCIMPRSEGFQAMRRLARGMHPQHKRGQLVGPVVALQAEHQDAAERTLNWHLQKLGRPKGRRARGEPPCPPASVPGEGGDEPALAPVQAAETKAATARDRMAALRARVAAKSR